MKEGSLEAPTRHPLDWKNPAFYDQAATEKELERVFDICHGCRRCVNLCTAFPTLFDLVDESSTMEVDGVAKQDYWKVVDQCYLCDMCYMRKWPYVPPKARPATRTATSSTWKPWATPPPTCRSAAPATT